ncbi:MAG TPA: phosphatidate cytidylyltransferase [Ruminococcaceae bacterium]|jgi:phosphatidate cytidylyltransferase|nr:phosphatidate cytidylyltransferase [Oscillospiraceae bacterium]HBT91555.1 phosphatidate cytidylyltransferase [Oscillospiraceae bacterium]HCB91234.1 phosphatidate cytidylyltransferase [Oscillospiraceae bacterium]
MRERVVSAMTLVLFLAAIVVFNRIFPPALNMAVALVSVLGVYEIILALGLARNLVLLIPSLLFAVAFPFLETALARGIAYFAYTVVIFGALIFNHAVITFREVGVIYSMCLLIPTALETLVRLRELGGPHGMFYALIGIFSAWISDVGGYLAGSLFGRHKLCPSISPKKTVEGVAGSFALNIASMLLFGFVFQAIYYAEGVRVSYLSLFLIGLFGTVLSILGDLSFSLIKRSCHIKDFSEIIPGHGGILDRFDSVIFEAPFVYLLVQFLPIIK